MTLHMRPLQVSSEGHWEKQGGGIRWSKEKQGLGVGNS